MEIVFSRKKERKNCMAGGSIETLHGLPGLPVIHSLTFCCEEMAEEVTQKTCSLSTDNPNEIWFHPGGEMAYYARYCPFCGERINAREIKCRQDLFQAKKDG